MSGKKEETCSDFAEMTCFFFFSDFLGACSSGEHVVGPVIDKTNKRVYYITPTCADTSRRLKGRRLTVWKAGVHGARWHTSRHGW